MALAQVNALPEHPRRRFRLESAIFPPCIEELIQKLLKPYNSSSARATKHVSPENGRREVVKAVSRLGYARHWDGCATHLPLPVTLASKRSLDS